MNTESFKAKVAIDASPDQIKQWLSDSPVELHNFLAAFCDYYSVKGMDAKATQAFEAIAIATGVC